MHVIMKKSVKIYSTFERFWHWSQVLLIFFLIATGFEIHNTYKLFGWENAVIWHNAAAWAFMVLIVFTIFWDFITGEWRQYIPTRKNLKAQLGFYITGIFKNAPHPVKKTQLSKLNPLQRIVYFGLKVLVIPVQVLTGVAYMFYRYPNNPLRMDSLEITAIIHTLGAFLLVVFVIIHMYLITTGHTILSNLKAMITGYEVIEEEPKTT